MKDKKINKIIMTAVFVAMTCISTLIIQIPSPMSGYINLGDCIVLLSAWLLGPWYGACAAGIGSALADILSGYTYYVPATLLIKGCMAAIAAYALKLNIPFFHINFRAKLLGGILAEAVMVIGYFLFASIILGNGLAALSSIPGNTIQGLIGIISAIVMSEYLKKSNVFKYLHSFI